MEDVQKNREEVDRDNKRSAYGKMKKTGEGLF
jgi:hypothetical protein